MIINPRVLLFIGKVRAMSEREIKLKVIEKADEIAKAVSQGKDIVITKNATGIVVKKLTVQKV